MYLTITYHKNKHHNDYITEHIYHILRDTIDICDSIQCPLRVKSLKVIQNYFDHYSGFFINNPFFAMNTPTNFGKLREKGFLTNLYIINFNKSCDFLRIEDIKILMINMFND